MGIREYSAETKEEAAGIASIDHHMTEPLSALCYIGTHAIHDRDVMCLSAAWMRVKQVGGGYPVVSDHCHNKKRGCVYHSRVCLCFYLQRTAASKLFFSGARPVFNMTLGYASDN